MWRSLEKVKVEAQTRLRSVADDLIEAMQRGGGAHVSLKVAVVFGLQFRYAN